VDEVLSNALTGPMAPIEWEPEEVAAVAKPVATEGEVGVMTH
jgi:hypothetical protein